MSIIKSPNTVLANALDHTLDIFTPRIMLTKPKRIDFVVGTQINGKPHIGTYIVLTGAFVIANHVFKKFGIPVVVKFGALDNAPYEVVKKPDGLHYQKTFGHAIGEDELHQLISGGYVEYLNILSELTEVSYQWSTYASMQQETAFRNKFFEVLDFQEELRWITSPSKGDLKIRIPCPHCDYSEKHASKTFVTQKSLSEITVKSFCYDHGEYDSKISINGNDDVYLDLNTLVRNVVKEAVAADDKDILSVMVKGGDWVTSCSLIDLSLGLLGYTANQTPMRFFTPEIVTSTGAKLSKSLIREGDSTLEGIPDWVLDMSLFSKEYEDDYAQRMIWLIEQFISNPRHMFRSYNYLEIIRLLESYGG